MKHAKIDSFWLLCSFFPCSRLFRPFHVESSTLCRDLTKSQLVRSKTNRENTRQRKIITRTRQYLHGSPIYLRPRSCRDFTIIKENTIVHKNTLKKPKSQYTLTLSHPQDKKILFFFLCGCC